MYVHIYPVKVITLEWPKRQCRISKNFSSKLYREIKDQRANSVDLDEVAHYEPPHLDLHSLLFQLLSFFDALSVKT